MEVVLLVRYPTAFAGSLKKGTSTFPFEDLFEQDELMSTYFSSYRPQVESTIEGESTVVQQAALLWRCLSHASPSAGSSTHPCVSCSTRI